MESVNFQITINTLDIQTLVRTNIHHTFKSTQKRIYSAIYLFISWYCCRSI